MLVLLAAGIAWSVARALEFADIKVQSNGLVLGQGDNVDRLIAAGVTRFHISIHTHAPDRYERLVRRAGTYPLMLAALERVIASGAHLVVDVILKEDTYRDLPAALAWLDGLGARHVDLWFVSLTDGNRDNVASLPRMTDALPFMREAFAFARGRGITVRSLHVPRCLLGDDHPHAFDPGAQRVMVVTPEATFELRDSKLAGQQHVPCCSGCAFEAVCPGVRPDYLARYGDDELAAARGQAPTIRGAAKLPVLA